MVNRLIERFLIFSHGHAKTFGISLSGVLFFQVAGLPLPWLLGTLCACIIAAFFKIKIELLTLPSVGARTIVGVAAGSFVTVALLESIITMWSTLLLILLMTIMIGMCGVPYFYRYWGYDWPTSYYSAMPGGLTEMLILGEGGGANVRTISLIHATRIMVIVIALPLLMNLFWQIDLDRSPGSPLVLMGNAQIFIILFCCLASC